MAWYMKFEGVDGESEHKGHEKWCKLESVSHAIQKTGGGQTGASRRGGAAQFTDIVCSKEIDKSSTKLQESIAKGKVFPKVELHSTATYGDAEQTYLKYELKNAQLTSYSLGSGGEMRGSEQLSLNFEEIKVTYDEYDKAGKKKGALEYNWKVEEATK